MVSLIVHSISIIPPPFAFSVWKILLLLLCYHIFFCLLCLTMFFPPFSPSDRKQRKGEGRDERRRENEKKSNEYIFPCGQHCVHIYICIAPLRYCVGHSVGLFFGLSPLHRSGRWWWRRQQHAFSHSIPFREPGLESQGSNSLILRGITQGRSLTTNEAGLFPQGEFSYFSSSHSAYILHPQPLLVLRASLSVPDFRSFVRGELTKFL